MKWYAGLTLHTSELNTQVRLTLSRWKQRNGWIGSFFGFVWILLHSLVRLSMANSVLLAVCVAAALSNPTVGWESSALIECDEGWIRLQGVVSCFISFSTLYTWTKAEKKNHSKTIWRNVWLLASTFVYINFFCRKKHYSLLFFGQINECHSCRLWCKNVHSMHNNNNKMLRITTKSTEKKKKTSNTKGHSNAPLRDHHHYHSSHPIEFCSLCLPNSAIRGLIRNINVTYTMYNNAI